MNGFRKSASVLLGGALCALSAWTVQPTPASAETETGDRPEIIVPRAGGQAAFVKFGCITCHLGEGGYPHQRQIARAVAVHELLPHLHPLIEIILARAGSEAAAEFADTAAFILHPLGDDIALA